MDALFHLGGADPSQRNWRYPDLLWIDRAVRGGLCLDSTWRGRIIFAIDTTQFNNAESQKLALERAAEKAKKLARKKAPPKLAVIDQSGCTGCEACIVFCPVDSIEIVPGADHPQMQQIVEIDLQRCIGCALCAKHCPWDTILMLPTAEALTRSGELTLRTICDQATQTQPALTGPATP